MVVSTTNMRVHAHKTALKAVLACCALASLLMSQPAFAQSEETATASDDRPMTATAQPLKDTSSTLPDNLQPENIPPLQVTGAGPASLKHLRAAKRNSWDPATLTQSAGDRYLAQEGAAQEPNISAGAMPNDILTPQALLGGGDMNLSTGANLSAATARDDGVVSMEAPLKGTLFNLPVSENPNASVFKLDMGGLCLGTADDCARNEKPRVDVGYAKNLTHGKYGGFNLQLTPRAGVRFDQESQSAVVGAVIRIGDNLREGSEMDSNTWYFFAGADAEAITYTPNSMRRLTSGAFHLQDRIIVGDAQAGLGYRIGTADLALTYFKRQASAEGFKYDEDAAALSITWKR